MKKSPLIHLTPPLFSLQHIEKKIVCTRGHRERIFRVQPESLNGKTIFHNYGQGGAGLSFLFGCVNESIRQFEQYLSTQNTFYTKPICVIGAGCYGLLTAILLARKGYNVHIVASEKYNLPSYNAAGFFFPGGRRRSNAQEITLFKMRSLESFLLYQQIINKNHPFIKAGAYMIPGYFDLTINPGLDEYVKKGLIPSPRKVSITFDSHKTYEVIEYLTLFINSQELMHELNTEATRLNIKIITKTIATFDEINESIIFNCSGFGARALANDATIIPVQGHLISLKNQPTQNTMHYLLNVKVPENKALGVLPHEFLYYTPKNDGLLGITFLRGKKALQKNLHEFENLLQRCKAYFGPGNL